MPYVRLLVILGFSLLCACASNGSLDAKGPEVESVKTITINQSRISPDEYNDGDPGGISVLILRDKRREGRRVALLTDDWFYCYPPTGELFRVPAGYVTDFASIPAAARGLIDPTGDELEAALIHDWMYAVGERGHRLKADMVFLFAMQEQGVDWSRRTAMYRAVRLFGGSSFGKADEWANFMDWRSNRTPVVVAAPIPKPQVAAVERVNCNSDWEFDLPQLRARHHTPLSYVGRSRSGR